MMRSIKSMLMGGAILLGLAMCLTSCEGTLDDIFGEWSRPTGNNGNTNTTVAVKSVTLDEANLRFVKTDLTAQTLTATVTPSDATDKTVTWTSSDEAVATVANGVVTPIAPGKATITAKAGDKTATSTVYVYDKIVDISTDISVDAGESWLINGTGTTEAKSITITIANNSKVTLNGINITKGINCTDNATIILADGSENTVTAPSLRAGIIVGGPGKTFTINAETEGTGILNATGGTAGAGIGTGGATGSNVENGNITINGGTVTAKGGAGAAGIGTGYANGKNNKCGTITINGGTVTATGDTGAAGIGTGYVIGSSTNECGAITIAAGVKSVTATKGTGSPNSIGKGEAGSGGSQTCGTITIGGVEYWDGTAYQNGGDTYLTGNIIYPAP